MNHYIYFVNTLSFHYALEFNNMNACIRFGSKQQSFFDNLFCQNCLLHPQSIHSTLLTWSYLHLDHGGTTPISNSHTNTIKYQFTCWLAASKTDRVIYTQYLESINLKTQKTCYNTGTNIDAEVTRWAHIKQEIVIKNHQKIGHCFVANR